VSTNAEFVTLLLAMTVAVATVVRRRYLLAIPHWPWLAAAGVSLLVAWSATVLEDVWAPAAFNVVEHAAYLAQSVLLTTWIVRVAR
jgi:hypothetical protein